MPSIKPASLASILLAVSVVPFSVTAARAGHSGSMRDEHLIIPLIGKKVPVTLPLMLSYVKGGLASKCRTPYSSQLEVITRTADQESVIVRTLGITSKDQAEDSRTCKNGTVSTLPIGDVVRQLDNLTHNRLICDGLYVNDKAFLDRKILQARQLAGELQATIRTAGVKTEGPSTGIPPGTTYVPNDCSSLMPESESDYGKKILRSPSGISLLVVPGIHTQDWHQDEQSSIGIPFTKTWGAK